LVLGRVSARVLVPVPAFVQELVSARVLVLVPVLAQELVSARVLVLERVLVLVSALVAGQLLGLLELE
jgi:hypothetical protein